MDCSNTNIKVLLRGHLMSDEPTSDLFWEDLLMCRKTPIIYGINIQFGHKICYLLGLRKLVVYPILHASEETSSNKGTPVQSVLHPTRPYFNCINMADFYYNHLLVKDSFHGRSSQRQTRNEIDILLGKQ
ncbi:hypothetical protein VNO80_13989 [Phaseolus coccineus]|uniref:Uncharacterized protein n=1 Tax=Phaseolus coccineus TaxID=3886 RepID=A0AAN9N7H7_PHACN